MEDLEQSLEVRRKDTPHLWNLNEDPALSDVIVHFVDKGDGGERERGGVSAGTNKQPPVQATSKSVSVRRAGDILPLSP